jgi:hypothetical protein
MSYVNSKHIHILVLRYHFMLQVFSAVYDIFASDNRIYITNVSMYVYFLNSLWPSWPWLYGSWIYNYLCNQCPSPLMLWVRISTRTRRTTLCDKVYQWLAAGRWFSTGPPVSSTNKTDRHDITEILLKVALSTIVDLRADCLFCWYWGIVFFFNHRFYCTNCC